MRVLHRPRFSVLAAWPHILRCLLLSCLLNGLVGSAHAGASQQTPPTIESVNLALEQLEDSTAAEAPALKESYQETLDTILRTQAAATKAANFNAEAAEAPVLLVKIRDELARPSPAVRIEELADPTLEELIARVDGAQAALETARSAAADLDSTAASRTARKAELPGESAQAEQALSSAEESLAATPTDAASNARRDLLLAEVAFQKAQLQALAAESNSYAAKSELLPLRRDRAARDVASAEQRSDQWRQQLKTFRQKDGESAASEAQIQLADVASRFPGLEPLASKNSELAALRSGDNSIPSQLSGAQEALERDRELLDEVTTRYASAKRRSELGSLSESTGYALRQDYEWLPRKAILSSSAAKRVKALSEAELQALEHREERTLLSDIEAATRAFVAGAKIDSPEAVAEASLLLEAKRDSLDVIVTELESLTDTLYKSIVLGSHLQAKTETYRSFIEQRILWVRSSRTGSLESIKSAPGHMSALAESIAAIPLGKELRAKVQSSSGLYLLVLLAALAILVGRYFLRDRRVKMDMLTRSYKTDRYLYTLWALAQTLLAALPMPLLAWLLGTTLMDSTDELARAAGSALLETSLYWLTLKFLAGLLVEKGVGNVHFRWAPPKTAAVLSVLRWSTPILVVFGFLALALDRQSVSEWSDTLGRLSFMVSMGSLAFALHRLLREESALWGSLLEKGQGLLLRTHRWWSLVVTGAPLALMAMAASGYYYTALQLELRIRYSLALGLGLVLVNALLLRWLFIARRRLAVAQALEARAQRDKEEEQVEKEGADETNQAALDTEKVDIPSVDAQTRELFKSSITLATVLGLYLIWAAALPALQGLRRVQLLPHPAIVATASEPIHEHPVHAAPATEAADKENAAPATPYGAPAASAQPAKGSGGPSSLTLADVVIAAILGLLTSVAARNLPALLELALLARLPLDGGSRYAVTTLLRYAIIMVGVSSVSGALGVGWEDIQWLAAALTFGLAFGLQEIFANFISGIIILIERPVRVGDIVTVDGTEGTVSRLRMRSTTIVDWDRREHLIPNKQFITSSVVNWTLSDPLTRIIIAVGIAYGSDTDKARSLLLQVARKSKMVVKEPGPSALFRKFGDSTLDFELRVYVANRDLWPLLIDELHSEIDAAFRKAGIEIAFPQRDLHIRSGLSSPATGAEPS